MSTDARIAFGARCVWWDSIDKVAATESGLPCCPACGGVLFEVESEAEWWRSVDRGFDSVTGEPLFDYSGSLSDYRRFLEWSRGRCYPNIAEALLAYPGSEAP